MPGSVPADEHGTGRAQAGEHRVHAAGGQGRRCAGDVRDRAERAAGELSQLLPVWLDQVGARGDGLGQRRPRAVDRHPGPGTAQLPDEPVVPADGSAGGQAAAQRDPVARAAACLRVTASVSSSSRLSQGPGSFSLVVVPSDSTTVTFARIEPAMRTVSSSRPEPASRASSWAPSAPPLGSTAFAWRPCAASARATLTPFPPASTRLERARMTVPGRSAATSIVRSTLGLAVRVTITPAPPAGRQIPAPARGRHRRRHRRGACRARPARRSGRNSRHRACRGRPRPPAHRSPAPASRAGPQGRGDRQRAGDHGKRPAQGQHPRGPGHGGAAARHDHPVTASPQMTVPALRSFPFGRARHAGRPLARNPGAPPGSRRREHGPAGPAARRRYRSRRTAAA